jgi:hypothetical protein
VVALCADRSRIADLADADKQVFLADLGLEEPGLNRLIRAGYDLLGLQTYFTAGVKEVRAWTIHKGDTAPQAAGVIHTDFERGFIRAQTIAFDDFIACKGEQGAKEAGKMRAEGKDYVVKDGDVLNFLFNVYAVFVFHNAETMKNFVDSGWEFGANADAAAKVGETGGAVGGEVAVGGITVYQLTESGVALQASVKGTKYWKDDDLN